MAVGSLIPGNHGVKVAAGRAGTSSTDNNLSSERPYRTTSRSVKGVVERLYSSLPASFPLARGLPLIPVIAPEAVMTCTCFNQRLFHKARNSTAIHRSGTGNETEDFSFI